VVACLWHLRSTTVRRVVVLAYLWAPPSHVLREETPRGVYQHEETAVPDAKSVILTVWARERPERTWLSKMIIRYDGVTCKCTGTYFEWTIRFRENVAKTTNGDFPLPSASRKIAAI